MSDLAVRPRNLGRKQVIRCFNCGRVADAFEHCTVTGHDVTVTTTKTWVYEKRAYAKDDAS